MNRPEPIELENNLGPDAVTGEINRVPWMAYDVDEMDLYIAEKDKEIAELKKKLMPCLNGDCILTCEVVEKYGKENAELKQKLDKAIAERDGNQVCIDALKDEIKRKEGVGQRWFERCMEARTENVSLKRALWIARAERAKEAFLKWNLFPNFETTNKLFTIDEYDETPGATDGQVLRTCEGWAMIWQNVERKCRAKAEQYK